MYLVFDNAAAVVVVDVDVVVVLCRLVSSELSLFGSWFFRF